MSCITEILKLKGDKEFFTPLENGKPWISVEGGGVYKDYEYLIVMNGHGHRCGYVALPPEHPYSNTPKEERTMGGRPYESYPYEDLDISCHGGLTFMAPDHDLKELLPIPCTDMWIGFDCGHCDDLSDEENFKKYFGEEAHEQKKSFFDIIRSGYPGQSIKDFNYTEQQCHSIIDQLLQVAA